MGIFKSNGSRPRPEGGKTIVAAGCKISGEIKDLNGALHVDGRIDGVVETEFDISIGDEGVVTGLIKAKTIVVSGTLEGKVACESIDILSTGKMLGELICGEMMIEAGGKFIGESRELTEGGLVVSFPEDERIKLDAAYGQSASAVEHKNEHAKVIQKDTLEKDKEEATAKS